MTATATYNRKTKAWEVTANGRFLSTHPAGKQGQQEAEQAAIKHNDPEIYGLTFYLAHDLFRDYPELNGRLWRAAEIVINGDVRQPYHIDSRATVARVKSQNPKPFEEGKHHTIDRPDPNGRYYCSCYDFTDNEKCPDVQGQKLCKHIIAVKLMKLAKRPFIAWPEKKLDERDQWLADYRKQQEENGKRLTEAEMERQLAEKRENMRRWRRNREMQERQEAASIEAYYSYLIND